MKKKRSIRLLAFAGWVIGLSIADTVVFISAGWIWSEQDESALQVLTWGLASPIWLVVNLLGAALTSATLYAGGGVVQYIVACVVVFAGLAALQFLAVEALFRLARWLIAKRGGPGEPLAPVEQHSDSAT